MLDDEKLNLKEDLGTTISQSPLIRIQVIIPYFHISYLCRNEAPISQYNFTLRIITCTMIEAAKQRQLRSITAHVKANILSKNLEILQQVFDI